MKKSGLMQRLDKQADRRVEEARRHSRIFMLDMVTVALGRMGRREALKSYVGKLFVDYDKRYEVVLK